MQFEYWVSLPNLELCMLTMYAINMNRMYS